jgi:hypothetical protein
MHESMNWVQWQYGYDSPESSGNGSVSTLQSDGYSSMYQKTTVGFIKDEENYLENTSN